MREREREIEGTVRRRRVIEEIIIEIDYHFVLRRVLSECECVLSSTLGVVREEERRGEERGQWVGNRESVRGGGRREKLYIVL